MRKFKKFCSRMVSVILTAAMVAAILPQIPADSVKAAETGQTLSSVKSAAADGNVVEISFNDGEIKAKITFLEDDIFRYNVDPSGEFSEYATVNNASDTAKIPQYPDSSDEYTHPEASVSEEEDCFVITSGNTEIRFEKDTAKMTVAYNGKVVMQESKALSLGNSTTQTLVKNSGENFYGGGTQNGRFVHTGEVINIANESNWVDGGVASPNPFYYTSAGYGVLRNTFLPGSYDFGSTSADTVTTVHNENEFDAYYFLSDGADTAQVVQDILAGYYHVTGNPVLLPEYAFYEGHLNCYNRDSWTDTQETGESGGWIIRGSASSSGTDEEEPIASAYKEAGMATGYVLPEGSNAETLNGTAPTTSLDKYPTVNTDSKYSARAVIDQYEKYDMPLGYFLPNDGYGCGYGQNGYYMTGGVNADGTSSEERTAAIDANVQNLSEFTSYARSKGIETGLWTQSNLTPDSNSSTSWHLLRDFVKEVTVGGITTLKTDVAWVGYGYNFALNGLKTAYDIVTTEVSYRPNIITLDGWAGTQRYGAIWTGDQTGGNWEYIRFHVPTYIGQSLSGNPNIGSDMDGIFGGNEIISVRDTQWKIFTPLMLNMDGWGSYAKTPQTFGDPYTGISRMYLKLKAQLMPYIYTSAAAASNIDTGNGDTGLPMIRAMFLEYPDDAYSNTKDMQYQYMFGPYVLVAPVYTETSEIDEQGNDVRNGIYLPDEDQIWIDYFTGDQYYGGQVLNNFEAPIWKLPVFVKNGAIIPMWEENNSPSEIDKTNRIVEFWPAGETEYTMYEDDGTTAISETEEVDGYGSVNTVTYGEHVSTKFTSKVEGDTAVLTAEKSTGSYQGYNQNKNTTFIVNVSKEPTAITAMNGSTELTPVKAESKEEVLNADAAAGTFVYFYDEAPAIEAYTVEAEDEFIEMMEGQTSSPKLYVKFAETDSKANVQTLKLEGFENADADMTVNELNPDLAAPTNLRDDEERKTPTSNTLVWDAVEGATSYEILVDGIVNTVGSAAEFVHADQKYNSTHTYQVRARNAEGYSEWSEEISATTALDPWRNVPEAETIIWEGGDSWGALANATDHDTNTMFHSTGDVVTGEVPFILDYGKAYQLDKLEYYPRDNYGNGLVSQLDVYTSLDGVNWTKQHDGASDVWTYDTSLTVVDNVKTVDLTGVNARYVKLIVTKSTGNFFSANEIAVYKADGTSAFAVGSTLGLETIGEPDYSNMKNYLGLNGTEEADATAWAQISLGDINGNNIYEVYDYAFTMFNLDGGTTRTGAVSGNILLLPGAETVNAGETFTVNVYADNVKNLNAFGEVLEYDQTKLEYVSSESDLDIAQMENLTVNRVYTDRAYVDFAFANRGDQPLYSGSGIIASITMRAKTDVTVSEVMDLSQVMLIGPKFDTIVSENQTNPTLPEISTGEGGEYVYGTDFTMTITNEALSEDDGTNVEKLIQSGSYDGLFNSDTTGRDFEFKWDIESNFEMALPEYVTVPVTLHLSMSDDGQQVSKVKLYNANKANGYVEKAKAAFYYSDGTSLETGEIQADGTDYFAFTFMNSDLTELMVTGVDIVITSTSPASNLLTLSELEVVGTEGNLEYGADFGVTMTNEVLSEDDGSNVNKLIQQNSYDGLFDGNAGRDFEFKWDIESNYVSTGRLPAYITTPVTLHANMTEAKPVAGAVLYNANNGNGYVYGAKAAFVYEDGTSAETDEILADGTHYFAFEFSNPDETGKAVSRVDITITQPVGNMLTLSELKLRYESETVPVTAIAPAENNGKELYIGTMADINAVITPENATNPYFTAATSDESVARIITLADENGLPIYKVYAVGEGTAVITLTVLETADSEEPITAEYAVTVLPGADKTELKDLVEELSKVNSSFYTEETYSAYQSAYDNAWAVIQNAEATREEVRAAINALQSAYDGLVETELQELEGSFTADALYSESNIANNMFDDNLLTYWESPYTGNNAFLPKDVVIDLGGEYVLEKVEMISHTIQNGGVTGFEIWTSMDGETWALVYEDKDISPDLYKQGKNVTIGARFAAVSAKYVKLTVTGAVGRIASEDNMYGRIAELKLYGTKAAEPADKTELEALVEEYKALTQGNYTDESWKAFTEALSLAEEVLADIQATQTEIDLMLTSLEEAYKGLTENEISETVDKSSLQTVVDANADRKQGDYTAESWAKFSAALDTAKAVLAKENATQTEVNEALKNLEAAAAALQKPSEEDGTGNSSGDGSGSNSGGSSSGGSSGGSTIGTTSAPTGDSAQPLLYIIVIVAAAAVIIFIKKKTKNNE